MPLGRLVIVGTGLIGGSLARAVRAAGVASRVVGVETEERRRETALKLGVVDEAHAELGPALPGAEVVLFCTPVEQIAAQVLAAARLAKPGTLLTDVGSTKAAIVEAVERELPAGALFVGGHPLAGSEKTGPEFADARLFEDRLVLLTPTPRTPEAALDAARRFWRSLGARVQCLPPDDHDRALALTSHLPHLVASALAGILPAELLSLTASGFRDVTRLAAGATELWTGILLQNRPAVLAALDLLEAHLSAFRQALETRDESALRHLLEQGREKRSRLS